MPGRVARALIAAMEEAIAYSMGESTGARVTLVNVDEVDLAAVQKRLGVTPKKAPNVTARSRSKPIRAMSTGKSAIGRKRSQ